MSSISFHIARFGEFMAIQMKAIYKCINHWYCVLLSFFTLNAFR